MNKKLIILIGVPASGKSTYLKKHLHEYNLPYIASTDNIIISLHPELTYNEAYSIESKNFKKLNRLMVQGMEDAIFEGRDVIVDRTNMKPKIRKKYLAMVDDTYEKIAIVFSVDKKDFLERNKVRMELEGKNIPLKVYEEMSSAYTAPTKEEGFNKIIHIK